MTSIAIRFVFFACVVCFSMASFISANKHTWFSVFFNHATSPAKCLNVLPTRRIFSVLSPHVAAPFPTLPADEDPPFRSFDGEIEEGDTTSWKHATHEVWCHSEKPAQEHRLRK